MRTRNDTDELLQHIEDARNQIISLIMAIRNCANANEVDAIHDVLIKLNLVLSEAIRKLEIPTYDKNMDFV